MATYSPELLAALRQRYEDTDQPMTAIAAESGIGITTLQSLVRKNGWTPRSQRLRHCPPLLAAPLPPPESGRSPAEAESEGGRAGVDAESDFEVTPTLPLPGGGSQAVPADNLVQTVGPSLSPAERLQALVEKEIAAEEATRAVLGIRPRSRNEAERCARTISKLTQALQTIQKLRGGSGASAKGGAEMPDNIDEFREELARRIRGFIENRVGSERVALDGQVARLSDDELRELVQVGRERGMQALLQPPEEAEDTRD